MPLLELRFPVLGSSLPTDHAYALYSALSRVVPALHAEDDRIQIGPILGQYTGNGLLRIEPRRSRLRLRLPAEGISKLLPLAGKSLDVAGHSIRLGVPHVAALVPAPALIARMVTMKRSDRQDKQRTKDYMQPSIFLEAVRRELNRLGVTGDPGIPLIRAGPHAGQPRRHVLRIKNRRVVGFAVQVTGLTAEESIRLQEAGLGGRRKMGCGFLVGRREDQQ